ncbi:hypothetical protein SARC_03042 [Sphaeroforma arctica JP610]|uniref:Amino acid transporter transmembrane domain-containing protein n=1 Tax=Sphaeroforma arctica JP610 TaxID=667725 RepID=A0A0L0G788_9EUKA|nr:hypothetical protein SARC_03042 [Sphaeroforma arctica JP610]KNC84751.1 hypothetical protein SARC_03042 [Sphaeroforma arctica JP610]|eukprot:XP_014158653.1 hypothetical protein SARC_03042 [Sphaeroforma arctica JP610]
MSLPSLEMRESQVELALDTKSKQHNMNGDTMSVQSTSDDNLTDELKHGSGVLGTVMNMTNTIIGSGILSIPYSTAQVGWVLALVIMFIGATMTMFGLHLLNTIADRIGGRKTSFGDACRQSYPWLMLVADFLVFFTMWSVSVIYMTIASSILPDVMRAFIGDDVSGDAFYLQTWFWLIICWGCFAAPLSMLKSLWFLAYTSMVAVLCVLWTTFVVFAYSVDIFDPCDGKASDCQGDAVAAIWDFGAIMRAFPVFVLGFCVGPVLFNIYNAMDHQTTKRMDISAGITISLVTVLYTIIALCGYFTYGENVTSNILDSYPISVPASIARLGTAFVVTVSYPLLMHAARDSVVHAVGTVVTMCGKKDVGVALTDSSTKNGNIMFYVLAALLNIVALAFAYFQIDINTLLSITGAIGTVNLSFTLPAAIYWKMFEEDGMTLRRILCVPFGIFGLVAMCISLWANFA